MSAHAETEIRPATPERWDDVERLAGERGFYSGCWCMWWRLSSREFREQPATEKRAALAALVKGGVPPGLLAYRGGAPVGWVAVAPRADYPRLARSQKLKPVDERPAWAVSCFYIHRDHRRSGVAEALLAAAVGLVAKQGAELVEGYPIDTASAKKSSAELYTGTLAMFERAGFVEVERRGGRPIVRRESAVRIR